MVTDKAKHRLATEAAAAQIEKHGVGISAAAGNL